MTKKIDREAIIAELKREALDDPEIGWLSDLSGRDLEWDERDEVIIFGKWDGSIDVGQLAGIVEGLIDKNSQVLLSRLERAEKNADTYQTLYEQRAESLEQAEQAVQRVLAMAQDWEANGNSCAVGGRSADVWHATANAILRALDGDGRG